jgi:hypothetical protein
MITKRGLMRAYTLGICVGFCFGLLTGEFLALLEWCK